MADLKGLLGDSYKEGMTIEEVEAALADKEFVGREVLAEYVSKDIADKYATEAADYKKKYKATLDAAQQKELDEADSRAEMELELKNLRREKSIAEYKAKYLGLKYDEKEANEMAEALCDGDMDIVFSVQQRHQENLAKTIKSELQKQMPNPASGNHVEVDFSKQIAEAQANGNMVLAASLIRQQAEANRKKD